MLVAVDTGGTKTLIGVFSKTGNLETSERFPTPTDQNEYIELLASKLSLIHQKTPITAVCIASPGVIKNNIILWGGGNLPWQNVDLPSALGHLLPGIPILVENDANLGGLGETRLIKPVPPSSVYVTISTGIGAGIITNGVINPDLAHSEVGHVVLEFDGVMQQWERFASGKAIYQAYGKYAKDIKSKRTWHRIADRMSRGFLALIPILQPEMIIIGGSMGTHFSKYATELAGIIDEKLPEGIVRPQLIKAKHPEEAVLYGCYYYALDTLTA